MNHENYVITYLNKKGSRNRVVGIMNGYRLDDEGVGVQVPVGARIFTFPCHPD
jgi:hypothetical protein